MQINLKKARRLENSIKTAQSKLTAPLAQHRNLSISIHQSFDDELQAQQEKLEKAVQEATELGDLRFAIRKSIETKNELVGINAMMNEEAKLKDLVKVLTASVGFNQLEESTISVEKARHAAMKVSGATQTQFGKTIDSIELDSAVTEVTSKKFEAQVKAAQKRINKIVDDIGALNITTIIELTADQVALIEKHDIVV